MPQISANVARCRQLSQQVFDLNSVQEALQRLLDIHDGIESLEIAEAQGDCNAETAELVERLDGLFRSPLTLVGEDLEAFQGLRQRFVILKNSALIRLEELWKDGVVFKVRVVSCGKWGMYLIFHLKFN